MVECYHYHKKALVKLMFITVCMSVIVGCVTNETQPSTPDSQSTISAPVVTEVVEQPISIYFVALQDLTSQIWQIDPNQGEASVLYEIQRDFEMPASQVLPASEVEFLEATVKEVSSSSGKTPKILPVVHITNLALSPTRQALAWKEQDWYCVQETSGGCAGITRLMVLDLETGDIQTVFELPLDKDVNFISDGPIWSSDGKHIAIIHDIWRRKSTPLVFNVETEQVREFAPTTTTAIYAPLWSPDNSKFAWVQGDESVHIRFCMLNTEVCEDAEIEDYLQYAEWGPYGKEIVYTGFDDFFLHFFDPDDNSERKLSVKIDGIIENPHWAPSGEFLAVNNRLSSSPNIPVQSLLVIESDSSQIITQFLFEHSQSEWMWGADSNSILILTGDDSGQYKLGIFDIHTNDLKPIPLPDDTMGMQIRDLNW